MLEISELGAVLSEDLRDEARVELAVAARWVAANNLHEGVNNHISLRQGEEFLVNPLGLSFEEIHAGDFVSLPINVKNISNVPARKLVEKTASVLHGSIHNKIENANCIVHTHMKYATILASLKNCKLPMINQNGMRFFGKIAYDTKYQGLAKDETEGERIVKLMKDKTVLLMGNHGVIITGRSVAEAMHNTYYFEKACENYILALSTGRPLRVVPSRIAKKAAEQMQQDIEYPLHLLRSAKTSLEKTDPTYRELDLI